MGSGLFLYCGIVQGECGDVWSGRGRRSIEDQNYGVGAALAMEESQGLMVEREIVVEDRVTEFTERFLDENDKATDFTDNIGVSVIMPGGEFD